MLREGALTVQVDEHRDRLLAIRRGDMPWAETEVWRLSLQSEFRDAFESTSLPERPDYDRANTFLVRARRMAMQDALP